MDTCLFTCDWSICYMDTCLVTCEWSICYYDTCLVTGDWSICYLVSLSLLVIGPFVGPERKADAE